MIVTCRFENSLIFFSIFSKKKTLLKYFIVFSSFNYFLLGSGKNFHSLNTTTSQRNQQQRKYLTSPRRNQKQNWPTNKKETKKTTSSALAKLGNSVLFHSMTKWNNCWAHTSSISLSFNLLLHSNEKRILFCFQLKSSTEIPVNDVN